MNLLQELQSRTATARKATSVEVGSVYGAIISQCLHVADMGKDNVYVDSSNIEADVSAGCRESSFDNAFTRALVQVADGGIAVKTTREVHLFLLDWKG